MTAEKATSWLDAIDTALAVAAPSLGEDEQRLAAAVLRMLSAGQPVGVSAAAAAAEIPAPQAAAALQSWPAVFWDEHDQITGFWGLALTGMPHRLRRAGTGLGAWCAWDPLFRLAVHQPGHRAAVDRRPSRHLHAQPRRRRRTGPPPRRPGLRHRVRMTGRDGQRVSAVTRW